jgi:hypothetical protein
MERRGFFLGGDKTNGRSKHSEFPQTNEGFSADMALS